MRPASHGHTQQLVVAGVLILLGVMMRLVPHVTNFSPLIAIALFSGFYFSGWMRYAVPLAIMAISDWAIGFYAIMPVVWAAYLGMVYLSAKVQCTATIVRAVGLSIVSAAGFFVVTNVAVWAEGALYPLTIRGLGDCFVAALPFFRATLASAVVYAVVFFAGYNVVGYVAAHRATKEVLGWQK